MHDYTAYVNERVSQRIITGWLKHGGDALLYSKQAYTTLMFDDSFTWLIV